ncbi:tyrosine-type recombinase/integrase [Brackiella oedipodis]|uniref:tyrosine-type recombinase/integrase n=1 Tax=Brackiella oedipodis TaxID=124225 RepID=UPI0005713A51|nr:integrase arm-type DNA-binding domain-containing protein [Brackiella oedipodis]
MGKLTDKSIKSALSKKRTKPEKLYDGNGLHLHISVQGTGSWRFSYRFDDKQKLLTIGRFPIVSLREARILHIQAQKDIFEGIDPAAKKQQAKNSRKTRLKDTFEKYFLEWHELQKKRWKPEYAQEIAHQLNRLVMPKLGAMPITEVNAPIVNELVMELTNQGLGDTTRKTLQRINAIMNYAVQVGALPFNPVLALKGIVHVPPVQHQLALPEQELTEFFKRLIQAPALRNTKIALLITVLTFVRLGSLRRLEWQDIDLENKLWIIPKEKFKASRISLHVPLSDWVIALFKECPQGPGYIFHNHHDTRKIMSENALSYLMARMGYKGIATPHGFRSLATDILNEKSDFNFDVIERQMGHVERNAVRRAYHRTEYLPDRIKMMDWYSNYIRQYYDQAVLEVGRGI